MKKFIYFIFVLLFASSCSSLYYTNNGVFREYSMEKVETGYVTISVEGISGMKTSNGYRFNLSSESSKYPNAFIGYIATSTGRYVAMDDKGNYILFHGISDLINYCVSYGFKLEMTNGRNSYIMSYKIDNDVDDVLKKMNLFKSMDDRFRGCKVVYEDEVHGVKLYENKVVEFNDYESAVKFRNTLSAKGIDYAYDTEKVRLINIELKDIEKDSIAIIF